MKHRPVIYLDHAAATPMDSRVLAAMQPYLTDVFYNPSAAYAPALTVRRALETARAGVAYWLGSRPSEIIFTAGGTEANNLAIHGVMRQFPEGNAVVSAVEHESVLAPARRYACREAAVQADGRLDLDDLRAAIDEKTVLVSIMYANNEVGTIQPIRQAAAMVAELREARRLQGNKLPLYFHTDACQAANYLDLHAARLGVDLLTINGGKLYGPKQSGVLYVKAGTQLLPLVDGGGQERGLRSGTENVAASIGVATALDLVQSERRDESARIHILQQEFLSLIAEKLPQATVNGSLQQRLPNNIHLTIPGQDNERLLIQLDEAGILAAAGSACSADSGEASYVLTAMGRSEAEARSSLRFTLGRSTTSDTVAHVVRVLESLV